MRQQSSSPKRGDIIEPMKTLAQSDPPISAGTLVWAKFKDWPWWPGLVVTNEEVGWSISKKKDAHCILWLGPNKTASRLPADKIGDFLDQNLSRLINSQLNGGDYKKAIYEALRGLVSQQKLDDCSHISYRKLKELAVKMQTQQQEIDGRKIVVMDRTSTWYKAAIKSLENSNKSINISVKEEASVSPAPSRKVARMHTHAIMRTSYLNNQRRRNDFRVDRS